MKCGFSTSPFFRQSPFRTFRQTFQGGFVVDTFVEMFEMEIVEKRGLVADGWFGENKVTKIWEGGTKDEIRIFEVLFKGVSTRFVRRTIEKSVENPDFIFCSSFPNLLLASINLRWNST